MTPENPPTIECAQQHIKQALKAQGYPAEQYMAETRWIMAHIMGKSAAYLLAYPENRLTLEQWANVEKILHQRCQHHTPLQYILGHTHFYGRQFLCSPAALIPRPETEQIIELALPIINQCTHNAAPTQVLDIGTGTGCIAITLALETNNTQVSAMDIADDAIALAQQNAHNLNATVQFSTQNILTAKPPAVPYHCIVSNPPYINTEDYQALPPHILNHEPKLALHTNDNGLLFYSWFAKHLPQWLAPNGWFIAEFGTNQANPITQILTQHQWRSITIYKDLAGLPRMVVAQCPPKTEAL